MVNDKGGNKSGKKLDSAAKTDSPCLRRSSRGTTSKEQSTSTTLVAETSPGKESSSIHSNTRKSVRLENKDTTPPAKRKSVVLEKEKKSASQRRSDSPEKKDTTRPAKRKLEVLEKEKKSASPLKRSYSPEKKETTCQAKRKLDVLEKVKKSSTPLRRSGSLEKKATTSPAKRKLEVLEKGKKSSSPLRKPDSLEKKDTTLPAKNKLEVLEKGKKSTSALRRSDRGKKHLSPVSSDSNKNLKVSALPNVKKKKMRREKSMKQLTSEGTETSETIKEVQIPNGRIRMGINGHIYKAQFVQQKIREFVPDLTIELEKEVKLSQDDKICIEVGVMNPVEDGEDGVDELCEKIEVDRVDSDCGEKELFVSKSNNDDNLALSNHEKLDSLNSKCSSREALGALQENGANVFSGNTIDEEIVNDPKVLQVDHVLVVDLHPPELERLPTSNVGKGIGLVSLPSAECEKDNFVGACTLCFKKQRVDSNSPANELCVCSIAPTNDLWETSRSEDRVELARCGDSHNDAIDNGNPSTCAICKLDGELMCCGGKGCKQSYHLACLDIPLDDFLPGVWHCVSCVKKKIEYGVHSVSLGAEAIWDAREVDVQDDKGLQRQMEFFVKYKGLSHIHNKWVPETRLKIEASALVSEFYRQKQDLKWRQEWIEPQRLLKKRLLWSSDYRDNSHSDTSNCQYEWLVKWRGLDYEHVTWELENAPLFCSPEVQSLQREFENRHQRSKVALPSSSAEKGKQQPIVKVPKLPAGCSSGDDHNQLTFIQKLGEFWSKGQNAIVIEDQKRLTNLILFIASLVPDVTQPFLIISSPSALSLWEAEFSRSAPFVNVVVYSGNRDSRKVIRASEFYADRDRTMLQVLVSSAEAVVEDLEVMFPRWEAIVVDECQDTGISKHFEHIKMLKTAIKILLFNGQLKETTADYLNLLSLLGSPENLNSVSGLTCCELRGKFLPFIAYDCRPDSSRFIEYWVPISTSNVQLEQYCSTLLSSSATLLCSPSKVIVEALQDILISAKKCCDHPYFLDSELQGVLTKDLPPLDYLGVGIKASGKLHLLDTVLSEIKSRGKRVLILYQSFRSAGILIGDILDDFVRQRFGLESYERVDGGLVQSKKQAALKKFNDKNSGRFVFLLEKRACTSTIKLSCVDAVVIFNSDWNIMNDSRALHKLSIDSSPEPIKIFRLYTSCTLEEKVLDLATNHVTLDSNLHNISRTTCHMLLMWGASYLFRNLDEFHGSNASNSEASLYSEMSMLKDVAGELLDLLIQNAGDSCKSSLITKVQQIGVTYSKDEPLFGQGNAQTTDGKDPHVFWNELLNCKNPRWRFVSTQSQRNRKRVQTFGDLAEKPHGESGDVTKKQKKTVNVDSPRTRHCEGSGVVSPKSTAFMRFSSSEVPMADSMEGIKLCDLQKNLHVFVKPTILGLSNFLQIPEDVRTTAEIFLDYIVDNHKISSEPESILQAFQISVIWIAASLLGHKLDKKQSLDVAKQKLGFGCTEKEVIDVYSKLRPLKKTFKKKSQKFKELESKKDYSKERVEHIYKKCEKQKMKLLKKQEEEIREFNREWEMERAQIEKEHRAESAVVRAMYFSATSVKLNKLKMVDDMFAKKLDDHKREKELRLQELMGKQLDKRTEEDRKVDSWLKKHAQENALSVSANSSVGGNLSIEEQIPDGATSSLQQANDEAPNDFAGGTKYSETSKCDGESDKENTQRNGIINSNSDPLGNCDDAAGSSKHDDGTHTNPPLVTSAPAQDAVLLQNLAPQECPRLSSSSRIIDEDATGCGNNNPFEQAVFEDPTSADITAQTSDAQGCVNNVILEQAAVRPLLPIRVDVSCPDSCASPLVVHDGNSGANERYDVADSIEGENPMALPNSEITVPPVERPPSNIGENSNMHSGESMLPPPTQAIDEVLNHYGAQIGVPPPTNTHVAGLETHHPFRPAQYMDLLAQPCPSDPLQNEMDRLHKRTEEIAKLHEDATLQLKSEYEKDQAELRRKYEAKLKDTEGDYLLEKEKLNAHREKVFMNRILAETFHTKCLEFKSSVSTRMHQVPATNFLQQLILSSSQSRRTAAVSGAPNVVPSSANPQIIVPSVRTPPGSSPIIASMHSPSVVPQAANQQTAARSVPVPPGSPPIIANMHSPSVVPAAANQQTAARSVPAPPGSPPIIASMHSPSVVPQAANQQTAARSVAVPPGSPPIIANMHSPSVVPQAANQQTTARSVPAPSRTSPVIASTQMMQPRWLPNTRPIGNFSVSGERRAPAPHLRPSPISVPSVRSAAVVSPGQDLQRRTVTQALPGQPLPPQQPLMKPPNQPIHQNHVPHTENMNSQNPSVPAVGLLNVENSPGVRPPNIFQHEPDSGSNFVGLYISQGTRGEDRVSTQGGTQTEDRVTRGVNRAQSSAVTDVVCLSDDD